MANGRLTCVDWPCQRLQNSEVKTVVAVHNERDTLSPWIPAKEIFQAIDTSRVWEDATPVRVVSFIKEKSRKDKCAHQYWLRVVDELIEEILVARSNDYDTNIEKAAAKKLKTAAKEKNKGAAVPSSSLLSSSSTSLPEKPLDLSTDVAAGIELPTIEEEKATRTNRPVEVAPQMVLPETPQIEDDVRVLILPRSRARLLFLLLTTYNGLLVARKHRKWSTGWSCVAPVWSLNPNRTNRA
eukprot:423952-Amphidinium_carterae.1